MAQCTRGCAFVLKKILSQGNWFPAAMRWGKSGLDRVRVRFAKQLNKETWGFEDPSIKGTFVWSRSAGQENLSGDPVRLLFMTGRWRLYHTAYTHSGTAERLGLPNPAPASLPPVPGTPIPEEQGPNIETLPIEDRDFNDFIIVDPMGVSRQSMFIFRKLQLEI